MSLTKEDLQAIRELMREEIKAEVEPIKEQLQVVRDSQLLVEYEKFPEIQAALDGLKSGQERDDFLDSRVTFLEAKAEDADKRLFALECAAGQ